MLDSQSVRIVIVDDHTLVRTALRMLVESRPGFRVVGEAADCKTALAVAAREQPDVILYDLVLNGHESTDVLPELLAVAGRARVLVVTGARAPELHRQAIRLGAKGLIFKEDTSDTLLQAIEKVHAGEVWLDPAMITGLLDELSPNNKHKDPEEAKIASLSPREREVIALIGEGLRNKEIGKRLFISETTVRHHLTSIFNKLSVSERLELVIYAYRHGLARIPS
jgi:two-component system, NarL family, nitrate/nitrite response regulator NarL